MKTNEEFEVSFSEFEKNISRSTVQIESESLSDDVRFNKSFEKFQSQMDKLYDDNTVRQTVISSMDKDPDRMVQVNELSTKVNLPPQLVEDNYDELQKRIRAEKISSVKNTPLAKFFANPYNAQIAHDDIDVLDELGKHLGGFNSGILSLPQMMTGGTAAVIEAGGRLTERGLSRVLPKEWLDELDRVDQKINDSVLSYIQPANVLRSAESVTKSARDYVTPQDDSFSVQVAQGLGQVSAQIGLMLVAPQTAFPALFAQNVSQQEERRGDIEHTAVSDVGLISSGGLAIIERFGLEKLLNRIPPQIENAIAAKLTDVALGAGYEAVTEVLENVGHGLIDYMTANPNAEIFKGVQEEATVAGTVGAIVRALIPSYKGNKVTNEKVKEEDDKIKSQLEQVRLDKTIELMQKSNLVKRSDKGIAEFVESVDPDIKFRISNDIFDKYDGDLPDSIIKQANILGDDVILSTEEFTRDVLKNETLLQAVRPFLKTSEDGLTQQELQDSSVSRSSIIVEEAARNAQIETEVDDFTESVVDQIVSTGRLSKNNAKVSASVIGSYVSTRAKQLGLTANDIISRMNLKVVKSDDPVDFGDETIQSEHTLSETGQKVKITEKKQTVYNRKLKQKDMIIKLRDCVNG